MSISFREIKLKDNKRVTIEFDCNLDGKRKMFRPNIKYMVNPRTAQERQEKKEKLVLVKKMMAKLELDQLYAYNMVDKGFQCNKDFFEYCKEFINRKAPHSEMRTYASMVKKLKRYAGRNRLPCSDIDDEFLRGFKDFLDAEMTGVSAYNYFKKLRRIIKEAVYAKYFKTNPMERIVNSKGKSTEKETLIFEEVKALHQTDCRNEQIKNAFLFCCYTGLRFCDVEALTWSNIKNGVLDIVQIKTKERLTLKLHPDALVLLGKFTDYDNAVFQLPTHTSCLKNLKSWVKDAGINKHITWHCSRHTFATLLVYEDVGIKTVSSLLGHKSLRETETYVRVAEMSKSKAIENLRSIFK